ncbi:MAG TPA: SPASM domain-containing protein [Methanoregulaceae archaeon]|nr:SPASM domain-containing protein [Methanoregulaceae archaeon]
MKRKLGIIETLAHMPDLVLMDEPSMGLDFSSRMTLHTCIREIAGNGFTVIVATNNVYKARSLGQKVLLVNGGRVAAAGTPEQLIGGLGDLTMIELRLGAPIPLQLLEDLARVQQVHVTEDRPGQTRLRIFTGFERENMLSGLIAAIATKVMPRRGDPRERISCLTRSRSASSGNVYPCQFTQRPEFIIGNVRETPFHELWAGQRVGCGDRFRHGMLNGTPECRTCDMTPFCGGGCVIRARENSKTPGRADTLSCWKRTYHV